MRFQLSVEVLGDFTLDAVLTVASALHTVTLTRPDSTQPASLQVSTSITADKSNLSSFDPGEGGIPQITIRHPPEYEALLDLLKYLESAGSFFFGLRRIDWDTLQSEWIPESPKDESLLEVFGVHRSIEHHKASHPLTWMDLANVIGRQSDWRHLVIPMAFLREGRNDYDAQRYIQAFYNFYFVFEDLYGRGKTKNPQVERAFISSKHLTRAGAQILENLQDPGHRDAAVEVRELLKDYKCPETPAGLLKLLVKARGDLHHFSQHSTRRKGHPFNQRNFQPLALVAMGFALLPLTLLITGENPE